jgi:ATP-dependent Clp protease ATP-binding subunit ClpC
VVLENYSVGAHRVVSRAATEARQLGHGRVGTEHLLLGLLADDEGEAAAEALRGAGASLTAARHKVVEALGAGGGPLDTAALPFTPRAQRALERAGRFSRKDRESEVTAGHVLLGVLDVEGLACQVLRGLDVDIVHLRDAVVATSTDAAAVAVDGVQSNEAMRPRCPSCQAPLDDTLAETLVPARRDSGPKASVSLVYCMACGATLGVLRPEPS